MSLTTIRKSNNESEIFILKSKLESEGIKCFLLNQFTSQLMPQIALVELQVAEEDIERAKEILSEISN